MQFISTYLVFLAIIVVIAWPNKSTVFGYVPVWNDQPPADCHRAATEHFFPFHYPVGALEWPYSVDLAWPRPFTTAFEIEFPRVLFFKLFKSDLSGWRCEGEEEHVSSLTILGCHAWHPVTEIWWVVIPPYDVQVYTCQVNKALQFADPRLPTFWISTCQLVDNGASYKMWLFLLSLFLVCFAVTSIRALYLPLIYSFVNSKSNV